MDNVTITVPTTGVDLSKTWATATGGTYVIDGASTGTGTNLIWDNANNNWTTTTYFPIKSFEQLGSWNFDSDKGFYVCSHCGSGDYCVDPYEWVSCPWCRKSMATKEAEGKEIEIKE